MAPAARTAGVAVHQESGRRGQIHLVVAESELATTDVSLKLKKVNAEPDRN